MRRAVFVITETALFGVFMRGNKPPVLLGVKKGFSKDKTGGHLTAEKAIGKN